MNMASPRSSSPPSFRANCFFLRFAFFDFAPGDNTTTGFGARLSSFCSTSPSRTSGQYNLSTTTSSTHCWLPPSTACSTPPPLLSAKLPTDGQPRGLPRSHLTGRSRHWHCTAHYCSASSINFMLHLFDAIVASFNPMRKLTACFTAVASNQEEFLPSRSNSVHGKPGQDLAWHSPACD